MTGMSASSIGASADGARRRRSAPASPLPIAKPSATNTTSAETLTAASTFCTTRPEPRPRMWTTVSATIAASATSVLRRHDQRNQRERHGQERRGVGRRRHEAADVIRQRDRARRDRAGEAGDERRPPAQEPRRRSVGVAQVDVLAAGVRPQRGELGVRHRAGERQRAAERPDEQNRPRVGDERRRR